MSPSFDYARVNQLWGKAKNALGEAHDLMEVSPAQASVRLALVVALVNEMDSIAVQLADERAERVCEPYGDAWVPEFNRGQR